VTREAPTDRRPADTEGPAGEDGRERPTADGREETADERLDRNTSEMVQELRVGAVGVQVLFAFLLIVPFNQGWKYVTHFDRDVYFATLACIAIATALLLAPSVHHRVLFRERAKGYLVRVGNRLMISAMVFEVAGLTGIFVLIGNYVFGATLAGIAGAATATAVAWLWFGIPYMHKLRAPRTRGPDRQ
jgi:hypothetical protein